jgi:hypothetical protein
MADESPKNDHITGSQERLVHLDRLTNHKLIGLQLFYSRNPLLRDEKLSGKP